MTYLKTVPVAILLGAVLLATGACKQPHPGWEPPVEETSTRFLQSEVDDALRSLRDVRSDVRENPDLAEREIDDALRALGRLSKYYLPLLEARERTYNAHRFYYYGEVRRSEVELEAVERLIDEVAATGGPRLRAVMEQPLDLVSEARAAVMAASDEAPDRIESLAVRLNFMALKGGLELPDDWPPPADVD